MVGNELYDYVRTIKTRADFVAFVEHLKEHYRDRRGEWENLDLESYLSGLANFAHDMDGYYKNMKENVDVEKITWRIAADMLLAAAVYE